MSQDDIWLVCEGEMKSRDVRWLNPVLSGGDIESALIKWCTRNGPPAPLVLEMKRILDAFPAV